MQLVRSKGQRALFDVGLTDQELLEAIQDPGAIRLTVPPGSSFQRVLGMTRAGKILEVWYVKSGDTAFASYGCAASEEDLGRWESEG